jgi:hypothetical protein
MKTKGEAQIGKEWNSDCFSSNSDDEGLAASAFNKSSIFPNEHHTCLMANDKKVHSHDTPKYMLGVFFFTEDPQDINHRQNDTEDFLSLCRSSSRQRSHLEATMASVKAATSFGLNQTENEKTS